MHKFAPYGSSQYCTDELESGRHKKVKEKLTVTRFHNKQVKPYNTVSRSLLSKYVSVQTAKHTKSDVFGFKYMDVQTRLFL